MGEYMATAGGSAKGQRATKVMTDIPEHPIDELDVKEQRAPHAIFSINGPHYL